MVFNINNPLDEDFINTQTLNPKNYKNKKFKSKKNFNKNYRK